MANTKVTGDLIASGTITAANLVTGTLDGLLNTYLTTNTYATESYVTTAVNNLIDAAPASLDTLNELAAALNDDANFATTVTNSLATKLNLSGGTISGNLTVTGSLTGTLATAAQPNITSVGTLTSLTSSGTIATGQLTLNSGTFQSSGALYIGTSNADFIQFYTNNSNRVIFDSSGNVGIGTTNTGYGKLSVYDASNSLLGIANSTSYAQLQQNGANLYINTNLSGAAGGDTIFRRGAGALESMRIDSSGRVGIGTSGPATKLHIKGSGTGTEVETLRLEMDTSSLPTSAGLNFRFGSVNGATIYGVGEVGTGASSMRFYTHNGTSSAERMRIDSSGNVGIGTSSPNFKAHISTGSTTSITQPTAGSYGLYIQQNTSGSTGGLYIQDGASNSGNAIFVGDNNGAARFVVNGDGNVGIGTSTPIDRVHAVGGFTSTGLAVPSNTLIGSVQLGYDGTNGVLRTWNSSPIILSTYGHLQFDTNGSERMRIQSDSTIRTYYSGAFGQVHRFAGGASAFPIVFENGTTTTGSISISTTTTAYNTSSDYRLKENVVPMSGALDRVDLLQPARFNFIADPETTVDGFLAHEVQAIVPEAITGEKDAVDEEGNPVYQGIDQSKLVPLLVGAIQELKAEIELLKSQINA